MGFAAALVLSTVLAAKIIQIGPFFVPAGVLAFAFTFLCTDVIGELYGRAAANRVVRIGLLALLLTLVLVQLAVVWPAAPFWTGQQAFASVMHTSSRIALASVLAYLISQHVDVWLFHAIRKRTGLRQLWLRNTVSTVVAQLLDSVLFITLAFAGTGLPLGALILGQWAVKCILAAIDTPLVYLAVWGLQRGAGPRLPDEGA